MYLLNPKNFDSLKVSKAQIDLLIKNLKDTRPFLSFRKSQLKAQLLTLYSDTELRNAVKDANDIPALLMTLHTLGLTASLDYVSDIADLASSTAITSVSCKSRLAF